jgi:membrane protease YdiL (CAAX protease family)
MTWIKNHIFDIIAVLILLIFVFAWVAVLAQVWTYPTGVAEGKKISAVPRLALSSALVLAAGVLATTIGTQTAAALGFAVAEVANSGGTGAVSAQAVAQKLPLWTYVGIAVYLLVGFAVFLTWLLKEQTAPELVIAFALSLLGWLIGAASVVFKPATR